MKSTTTRRLRSKTYETNGQLPAKKSSSNKKVKVPEKSIPRSLFSHADEMAVSKTRSSSHVESMSKKAGGRPILEPMESAPRNIEALVKGIDKEQAQKFWLINRPYFFAVEKFDSSKNPIVDLEKLSKKPSFKDDLAKSLDEKYFIFLAKSASDTLPERLPSLGSLIELGVPVSILKGFWSLVTERKFEDKTLWPFTSRCVLAALFGIKNNVFRQDFSYAKKLTQGLSERERQNGLDKALYLATFTGKAQVIQLLLAAGASPDVSAGLYGAQTGLALAVELKAFDAVEEYLKAGANPDYSGDGTTITGREAAEDAQSQRALTLFEKYRR